MTTVLIVDDDDLVRKTLVVGLTAAGFAVLSASNGDEALDILSSETVDVLVTDMMMPEREGIELITELRRDGATMPIIAITGASTNGLLAGRDNSALFLKTAGMLGATRTLAKPFTPSRLAAEIRDCLSAGEGANPRAGKAAIA